VRGLADEAEHVAFEAEGAEDHAGGLVHGFKDAALFDVKFEIGFGVDAFEGLVGVENVGKVDVVFFECVDEASALLVGEIADFFDFEAGARGGGAEEAVAKARAFFVGPVYEFESDGRFFIAGIAAESFESGDDAEGAVEPAAVGDGIEMAAYYDSFVGGAGKSDPVVAGGVCFRGEADLCEFGAEPFASGAPDGAPGEALGAVGGGGEGGEFAEIGDDAVGALGVA